MCRLIIFGITLFSAFLGVFLQGLVPMLDGRIVGGKDTTIEEFPWHISMQYNGNHRCGGAILNKNTILTAAHCVEGLKTAGVTINAGSTFRLKNGVVSKVERLIPHPNYSSKHMDCDIAIIILKTPLTFKSGIKPIAIPSHLERVRSDAIGLVSGWGTTKEGGHASNTLQFVSVPIIKNAACSEALGKGIPVTRNMICAGHALGKKDACQGDSGGPLVVDNKLVGVVSWGYGCARPKKPGVYASVAALRPFIDKHMR